MKYVFERKINYYETDKMGVVHHSNYIRYLEEARTAWLESLEMPFQEMEKKNITIPVLGVNVTYKHHVTFADTILIKLNIKAYSGVRLIVEYEVINKATKEIVLVGETKHCFTNQELKPINLKKYAPEFSQKFEKLVENKNK